MRTFTEERQDLEDLVESLGMRPATSHPIDFVWLLELNLRVNAQGFPSMRYFHPDKRVDIEHKTEQIVEYKLDFAGYAWKIFKYPMIKVEYKKEDHILERRFFQTDLFAASYITVYKQGFGNPKHKFEEIFIKKGIDREELDDVAIKLKLWFGNPCSF